MSAFDRVIGYDGIKEELMQICDMIHNPQIYRNLGARLPRGILLEGDPGLGKTLLAKCFIEESGLISYTIRRAMSDEDFISTLNETFFEAAENSPSIVLLDDMDKFANEDDNHRDAEEYVSVQACIDDVSDLDVFVIATVNDSSKLPDSLIRAGRFDRRILVYQPMGSDTEKIVQHYLSDKNVSNDMNMEDIAKMISYRSCAELETILNEAAVNAAYSRKSCIEMDDIVKSVLSTEYKISNSYSSKSEEDKRRIALHEAGHITVSEVLCPGSVGLASVCSSVCRGQDGFIHMCEDFPDDIFEVLVSLAGKAASELYCSSEYDTGCAGDIGRASSVLKRRTSSIGTHGLGMIDISRRTMSDMSENYNSHIETVIHAELERNMFRTKDILISNREFLERTAAALMDKGTLLFSDIRAIREGVTIIPAKL